MIIRQLPSLATLPEVAAGFLPNLLDQQADISKLADIIQADPALTARIFSLAHDHGVRFAHDVPSVSEAVSKLPDPVVRDAVLSVKVFQAFDADYDPDSGRVFPRKRFAMHSLATACAARKIAEIVMPEEKAEQAFSAGLLHDIGKLALCQAMPKSFDKMVEQAREEHKSLGAVEMQNLGLDHMIIGKRLAEKWHLPAEIAFAIWMHHSDAEALSDELAGAKMAQVVNLADSIARHCEIGLSGSFDPVDIDDAARTIGLSAEQVEMIAASLKEEVAQKASLLGLEMTGGPAAYCEMMQETAADLAKNNTTLSSHNRKLEADAVGMSFIREMLAGAEPGKPAIEIGAEFVKKFQRAYHTGPACFYMPCGEDGDCVEAAVVDDHGNVHITVVPVTEQRVIPEQIESEFALVPANRMSDLLELFDMQIDFTGSFAVPFMAGGRAAAVMVFEQRMPVESRMLAERLEVLTSVVGSMLAGARALEEQSTLAERFASVLNSLKESREELTQARSLAGIAEMAAGAAHELNNPLAVISGRAQLLVEAETDENKKQMLSQIRQRTDEMAHIVNDLMSFAKPREPEKVRIPVMDLIDSAVKKTQVKHGLEELQIDYSNIQPEWQVNVDSEQVVTAIANVMSNALEAYDGGEGPIWLFGSSKKGEQFVVLQIRDQGRGMSQRTLSKAVQPFFSDKPAGRQRGMGLAQSQRLLRLNNATLTISSKQGEGTSVTVRLPRA
ncbi:Sporulation kinase D [Anaerohalosphaera lusitana]|uniref:histidine kinase n=2 Tax=Anaerohalosphaera lusitana TaxID=1936003 RepID=A0A1U9NJT5_9BACT|nr:Sporulation kinase D [Anaerohalosphaera lusitana]